MNFPFKTKLGLEQKTSMEREYGHTTNQENISICKLKNIKKGFRCLHIVDLVVKGKFYIVSEAE
jgi:hypothetical protein